MPDQLRTHCLALFPSIITFLNVTVPDMWSDGQDATSQTPWTCSQHQSTLCEAGSCHLDSVCLRVMHKLTLSAHPSDKFTFLRSQHPLQGAALLMPDNSVYLSSFHTASRFHTPFLPSSTKALMRLDCGNLFMAILPPCPWVCP